MEPTAFKGGRGLVGVVPIADHGLRAAMDNLAHHAGWDRLVVVIDQPGLDVDAGLAGRTGSTHLLVRFEDGRQRRHFGLAIEVPKPNVGEALPHSLRTSTGIADAP